LNVAAKTSVVKLVRMTVRQAIAVGSTPLQKQFAMTIPLAFSIQDGSGKWIRDRFHIDCQMLRFYRACLLETKYSHAWVSETVFKRLPGNSKTFIFHPPQRPHLGFSTPAKYGNSSQGGG
jgi:hypothetical protein